MLKIFVSYKVDAFKTQSYVHCLTIAHTTLYNVFSLTQNRNLKTNHNISLL